jgi:rhodanese-related sulfurtransferase
VDELEGRIGRLDPDSEVLIYCINGSRTRQAEPILLHGGFSKLYHLEGTFQAWIQKGLAIEKSPPPERTSW